MPYLAGNNISNLSAAQLTGALPALNASALTQLNAQNLTGSLPALNAAALTGINAANIGSGTLADARLSGNVTLQGNGFNTASKLVQLDAAAKLPAVDGSQLTNLSSASISGIIPVGKGGTGMASFAPGNLLFGNAAAAIGENNNLFWHNADNRLGIGTATPAKPLDIALAGGIRISRNELGNANNELYFGDNGQIRSFDDGHRILFDRGNNILELREYGDLYFSSGALTGNRTANAVLLGNGNFGIGTSSPTAKLDVNGTARLRNGATTNSILTSTNADGDAAWSQSIQLSGAASFGGAANIGGSASFGGALTLSNGVIQRLGTVSGTTDLGLYSFGTGNWLRFVTNGGDVAFYRANGADGAGASPTLRISGTTGHVAIDTAVTAEKLTVRGNISASGHVKQRVDTFQVSVNNSVSDGYTASVNFAHNLGYRPVIMMSLDYTGITNIQSYELSKVSMSYRHVDDNNIEISLYYRANPFGTPPSGRLNVIVVN
jgi:hypothetical protein